MQYRRIIRDLRPASLFWLVVSLGSCAYTQTVNNYSNVTASTQYQWAVTPVDDECHHFTRMVRMGHSRPTLPPIDPRTLTEREVSDLIFTYAERLKVYLDNEEAFLAEDIARHTYKCVPKQ